MTTDQAIQLLREFGDRGFTFHEAVQSIHLGHVSIGWTGMFPEEATQQVRDFIARREIVNDGDCDLFYRVAS